MNSLGVLLTSAELEGPGTSTDWSHWIRRGKAPDGRDGAGFATTWEHDLTQLAELGVTEAAFTVEWSRLFPMERQLDRAALEFRRQIIERARELGISPWLVLIDGTLPGWFADDMGGFNDERPNNLVWSRHIDWVGESFGDLAAGWLPMREPVRSTLRSQFLSMAPPGRTGAINATKAVRNVMLAEAEAWRLLVGTAPIATSVTARLVRPESENVKAAPHAQWADHLLNHSWFHAINEGELVVGDMPSKSVDQLSGAFDVAIVHLRPPILIDGDGAWSPAEIPLAEALAEAGHDAAERAGSRNVVYCADRFGISARESATEAGFGWWQSSPIDGWHWEHGFDLDPGIITAERAMRPEAEVLFS